ncbi:MAG: AbrB/MazE/SpoVT family DNA-binding domain-containing protein [Clostridia bacterium]|nr:AbrB/MazE/SpoVT family DNA-binding domain-containing protein [Clostridia bacterium]MBQ9848954.1 AbrB/MazE/SpoVT family DNA-binding domain-containing protein [Clostridia bacterium]
MKATGIVRRIDDLGRVVIPKEIRRTMRIREGDPLEIYTDSEGGVVFKKYSPIGELSRVSAEYAEAMNRSSGIPIAICDRDNVIAVAGVPRREYLEKPISNGLSGVLSTHRPYTSSEKGGDVTVTEGGGEVSYLSPIVSEGSVIGAVMSLKQNGKMPDGSEKKLIDTGAYFMSSQTDI